MIFVKESVCKRWFGSRGRTLCGAVLTIALGVHRTVACAFSSTASCPKVKKLDNLVSLRLSLSVASHGLCQPPPPQIAALRAAERAAERKVSAESSRSTETNGGAGTAAAAPRKRITGPSQSSLAASAPKPEQAAGPAVARSDGAAAAVEVAVQPGATGGETAVKKAKTHNEQDTGSAPTVTR